MISPLRAILTLIALAGGVSALFGQMAEPLFSQYYEMPAFYNPGSLGRSDRVTVRGGARLQWLGITHAPVSFAAVGDMPLKIGQKFAGVGLTLQQESYGLWRNTTIGAMAGYRFKLLGGSLMPGIRIGLINQNFKGSDVYLPDGDDYHQSTDDAIPTRDVGGKALDLGAGIFYSRPRWNAGLSILHANAPTITFESEGLGNGGSMSGSRDGEEVEESKEVKKYEFPISRSLYFTASGNIPIKNTLFELMPSIIAGYDFGSEWTGIATARLRYNKMLTAGLSYRYNDGVALHLALELKDFYIGYTYEYPLSAVNRASSGSHEIIAGYAFKLDMGEKNRHRQKSVRIL